MVIKHINRGVLIIDILATDMLIFTVSVVAQIAKEANTSANVIANIALTKLIFI